MLANALAYRVPALLHVGIARAGPDWELRTVDDGPGISAVDQARIRTLFAARSGNRPGASLGLSIVEEVMRAHHGHPQFGRTQPKGSSSLPCASRPCHAKQRSRPPVGSNEPLTKRTGLCTVEPPIHIYD